MLVPVVTPSFLIGSRTMDNIQEVCRRSALSYILHSASVREKCGVDEYSSIVPPIHE
jgi:hypothetical protein